MTKGEQVFDRERAEAEAHTVAQHVDAFLAHLVAEGFSHAGVLTGAHAAIVSAMVVTWGGKLVAERCRGVADQVQDAPSLAQARLAAIPPAGRA